MMTCANCSQARGTGVGSLSLCSSLLLQYCMSAYRQAPPCSWDPIPSHLCRSIPPLVADSSDLPGSPISLRRKAPVLITAYKVYPICPLPPDLTYLLTTLPLLTAPAKGGLLAAHVGPHLRTCALAASSAWSALPVCSWITPPFFKYLINCHHCQGLNYVSSPQPTRQIHMLNTLTPKVMVFGDKPLRGDVIWMRSWGWGLHDGTSPWQEGTPNTNSVSPPHPLFSPCLPAFSLSLSVLWGHHKKAAFCKAGREVSPTTLIPYLQPTELWENACWLSRAVCGALLR